MTIHSENLKKSTESYFDYGVLLPLNSVKHFSNHIMESSDGEHWKHSGWSGDFGEPYRHWCKFPEFNGVYQEIWDFIEPDFDIRGLRPERVIVNAYNHGDSSWLHKDSERPDHWTVIVYLNDSWNMNWGGETILTGDGGDIIHSAFPFPGRVILFDGRILHGPRPVSREAPFPRLGVAFQCIKT